MKPIYWAILLLALGLVVWLFSRRQRKSSGLPEGELLYSDSDYWQSLPKPLYDPTLQLVGKPDYVVKNGLIDDNRVLTEDPFRTVGNIIELFRDDIAVRTKLLGKIKEIKENALEVI